jgi:DUF4097 and DUF4098 domain-containing protein YvlB
MLIAFLVVSCSMAVTASGAREEESFSYNGIDRVEVQGVFLDVEIRGDGGASVSMRTDLQDDSLLAPRDFTVKHEVTGSTLRVWVEKNSGVFTRGHGTLFFRVPMDAFVSASTASGNVRIDSMKTKQVQATTASGNLQLSDLDTSLVVGSISGDVILKRARGDVDLTSISGDIEMSDVEGRISVKSISGDITGERLLLRLDSLFKTVSGDIDVDLENALDELHYDLSTVSGDLVVGGVRSSRGLQMGNGSLMLKGESVSGSQTYR